MPVGDLPPPATIHETLDLERPPPAWAARRSSAAEAGDSPNVAGSLGRGNREGGVARIEGAGRCRGDLLRGEPTAGANDEGMGSVQRVFVMDRQGGGRRIDRGRGRGVGTRALPIFVSMLCGLAPASLEARQPDVSERSQALSLAAEGRCEPALPGLRRVHRALPLDAEVAQILGECAIRLRSFGLAVDALEAARRVAPTRPRLDLDLGIAYYHLGRLEAAAEALGRAEEGEVDGAPERLLYSGLVALDRGEASRAVRLLSQAGDLDARSVEPMASFHLARAWDSEGERARAKAAFGRVILEWPETAWAEEARRALGRRESRDRIRLWGSVELGLEHDDNVLLRGRGVDLPSEISGQSDERLYWLVDGGALLLDRARWSGGVTMRHAGAAYREIDSFDSQAPGATLWLDRRLGSGASGVRLQYDFDAVWIDEDPFLYAQRLSVSGDRSWGRAGRTRASVSVGFDEYRFDIDEVPDGIGQPGDPCPGGIPVCGPPGLDERQARDRDGYDVNAALGHWMPLPWSGAWIEGELRYQRFLTEGREFDRQRHQVELAAGLELPWALRFSARGRYAYVPHDHPTTFVDPGDVPPGGGVQLGLDAARRREQEIFVRLRLERAFGRHVLVAADWSHTRNHSNSDVFDYDRQVVGVYVRIVLGD